MKLAGRSVTCASTVAVPNSLGPAELLQHYGTEEQKDHYLPRLARGEDIPCFALTGPRVGSDAAAIPDTGVVCRGLWQGQQVHRPAAQLLQALHHAGAGGDRRRPGVPHVRSRAPARRAGRPRHHLRADCRAIRRASRSARRHLPAQHPVPERPDAAATTCSCRSTASSAASRWPARAGACWSSSCRSGRCISLPSNATGGALAAIFATGAYARIRRQFKRRWAASRASSR